MYLSWQPTDRVQCTTHGHLGCLHPWRALGLALKQRSTLDRCSWTPRERIPSVHKGEARIPIQGLRPFPSRPQVSLHTTSQPRWIFPRIVALWLISGLGLSPSVQGSKTPLHGHISSHVCACRPTCLQPPSISSSPFPLLHKFPNRVFGVTSPCGAQCQPQQSRVGIAEADTNLVLAYT